MWWMRRLLCRTAAIKVCSYPSTVATNLRCWNRIAEVAFISITYDFGDVHGDTLSNESFVAHLAHWWLLGRWARAVEAARVRSYAARAEMCACSGAVFKRSRTCLFFVFYFRSTRYETRRSQWEFRSRVFERAAFYFFFCSMSRLMHSP